ncbi:DUF3990 domain-containing protein [Leptospira adleri]|uniref:DUF3990 domain-containing protein n=1 Tax=Leptospira adleri TaxID=2023186 RepID=UPI001082F011|nr:DUF3990 domain-containing protein [Leptospira adleri]TGM58577.1 DUF3990 domain-containing protein [Leptospira adleri]
MIIRNSPNYELMFHGTTKIDFKDPISNKRGGGELGQGFYCGSSYHNAKVWAFIKANKKRNSISILCFEVDVVDLFSVDIRFLDELQANLLYEVLKIRSLQRTFSLGCNIIAANILGKKIEGVLQYKWESDISISLINSNKVVRKEVDDTTGYNINIIAGK